MFFFYSFSLLLTYPPASLDKKLCKIFYGFGMALFIFNSRIFYRCLAVSFVKLYEVVAYIFVFAQLLQEYFVEVFHFFDNLL